MMPSSSRGLQGPRPRPLDLNSSSKVKKSKTTQSPAIIYVRSPRIIHTSPEEFMPLVQKLTGKQSNGLDSGRSAAKACEIDPLILTLGSPAVSSEFLIFSPSMHAYSKELGSSC